MNINKILGDIIRCMPSPINNLVQEHQYKKKIEDIKDKIDRDKKVFGIGLSRTRTTSLKEALEMLGMECVHFNDGSRISAWPEFYKADAVVDTPVSSRFESLYYTFEESKFIYTVRETNEWVKSVREFYKMESPKEFKGKWKNDSFWDEEGVKKDG